MQIALLNSQNPSMIEYCVPNPPFLAIHFTFFKEKKVVFIIDEHAMNI